MNEDYPVRASTYIALTVSLFLALAAWFIPWPLSLKIIVLALLATASFLAAYFFINVILMRRISKVNSSLVEAIRNEQFKRRLDDEAGELQKLEKSVRRLIREKTLEIDNLKELERLRREFLGDVAHELRSPIFNIQGYLHTLQEGAMEDEEVAHRFLNKATRHVDHLSALVEDLVTISRIEAGEIQLDISEFDLKELVHEVIELQDLAARQKNISLQIKYPEQPPLPVRADRPKIRQVLLNLVSNSIKYGTENGHTHIGLTETTSIVTIEVADNGEGISPVHLPRIFERFYRVDKSRARKDQPSSGLGLAIVKHFIEAHRQKVLVTSRPGIGSIFSFSLDKARQPA